MKTIPKIVKGLDPVADAFEGTVYTDIFSMGGHNSAVAIISKGVGATGTSTVTVEACSDVAGSAVSAIPFSYQAVTSGDTPAAIVKATTTGFATTAGNSQRYLVYIDASELAASGYKFCRLKFVQLVDSAVLGGVDIILLEGRTDTEVSASAIV